jgi:hypothetical protein
MVDVEKWLSQQAEEVDEYTLRADELKKSDDPWQRYSGWMCRRRAQEIREMSVEEYRKNKIKERLRAWEM